VEVDARWYVENTAALLGASVLLRHAPSAVSDGYVATRVAGDRGRVAGAVRGLDVPALLGRIVSNG